MVGLLSSDCPDSQREAALLLGQFATTDSDTKVRGRADGGVGGCGCVRGGLGVWCGGGGGGGVGVRAVCGGLRVCCLEHASGGK